MNLRRDVFQAIADPSRRAILTLLAAHAMTPGAIAEHFNSSRQTISKHLHILTECSLLQQQQKGRQIYYYLNAKGMKDVADFVEPFRQLWEERFNQLEAVVKKAMKKSVQLKK